LRLGAILGPQSTWDALSLELLAADHQHVMLGKGAVQPRSSFAVNSFVQVNAAHFGAGMLGSMP
jgi:hypothetical protein